MSDTSSDRTSARRRRLISLIAASVGITATAHGVTVNTSGSFRSEIDRQKSLAFGNASNLYVTPTAAQQAQFQTLAANLWTGNFLGTTSTQLDADAAAMGYEYVRFNDTDTGQVYYGLREVLINGAQTKGWGNFWANFNAATNNLVEVPHTLFDTNTEDLGARTFQNSAARGFIMAGAHRNANGFGTADVARVAGGSMFNVAHQAWSGQNASTTAWQLHGFDLDGIPSFPADSAVVVTNGDGQITGPTRDLNTRFESYYAGRVYAYNTYAASNPLNVEVNGGIIGTTFDDLGATGNDQGEYARAQGGIFMHVELDQPYRFDTANRITSAQIIADSMRATANIATTTIRRWDAGGGATSGSWTTGSGANWTGSGVPLASDYVVLDNTNVATLPAAMTLTAQNLTVRGLTWNSNQSSTLSSATTGSNDSTINLLGNGPISTAPLISMGASATTSTWTIAAGSTSTGSGEIVLRLSADGAIDILQPGATLNLNAPFVESLPRRRLSKTGAGTLVVGNSANASTGGWSVRGGMLSVPAIAALGPAPATLDADYLLLDGGTFRYTGATTTFSSTRGITLSNVGGGISVSEPVAVLGLSGPIVGAGVLTKTGAGTLSLDAAQSFSSIINVAAGRVRVTANGALGSAGGITSVNGGTLELAGVNYTDVEIVELTGATALLASGSASRFQGFLIASGDAGIQVDAPSLEVTQPITGDTLRKTGAGRLTVPTIQVAAANIQSGEVLLAPTPLANAPAGVMRVGSLAVDGGAKLDITNHALIIDYTGPSPLQAVTALLTTGRAGGSWNGPGVTSSVLAVPGNRAIGLIEAGRAGLANYLGQSLDSTSLVASIVTLGDTNLSGRVDFADLLALAQSYGTPAAASWQDGDFNYSGTVNFDDLLLLAQNYQGGGALESGLSANFINDWALAQTLVPEPSKLIPICCVMMLRSRKRSGL